MYKAYDVHEMLPMLDALQFHEERDEGLPAHWIKDKAGMEASP
jgi:peroxiredoxin (alkyl hydroperoxide reductase subunit C)